MLRPVPSDDIEHILEHTESLWRELRGQHLLVTGGTGFFGIWLLESLRAANARLGTNISATLLSRDPSSFAARAPHLANQPKLHWHRGDIRDFVFPEAHYDHIIHAATESSAWLNERQPDVMLDTIMLGTRRVIEFAVRSGTKSLLLTSSGAVYGQQPPELPNLPESYIGGPDINSPDWAYGEGKRIAELMCAISHKLYGLTPKIARCFAFVGPHLPLGTHFAAGNFIGDAVAGRPIVVKGDGTPYRSYMHPADLIIWLATILLRGLPNHPYNVGSDESVSIAELAAQVAACSGGPSTVNILGRSDGRPARRYLPSIARARAELGLTPRIGLTEALRRTFAWHAGKS